MLLNKAMKEIMKECYEYVKEIAGNDDVTIKSNMITELFRAHTDTRVSGSTIVEVENKLHEMSIDDDTIFYEPFIPNVETRAHMEFESSNEHVCLYDGNKKHKEITVMFQGDTLFGYKDNFESLLVGDFIVRSNGQKYFVCKDVEEKTLINLLE
jgi:ferredoxin-NADP reductase